MPIKYIPEDTTVVFSEIPDEITLAVNISNCQNNCKGCHSPYLKEDAGDILTFDVIDELIEKNKGITCFCFMGEGNDPDAFFKAAEHVAMNHKNVKLAVYSGRENVEKWYSEVFDYVKIGPYIPEYGALDNPNTNQRLYYNNPYWSGVCKMGIGWEDITEKFWKKPKILKGEV